MEIGKEWRPQHKWSLEERQLLCLLRKVYQITWPETTAIMNNALAEQLKAEGFLTGLPETTVRGQFDEMRREGARGHDTLRTICVDLSIGEARKGYRELRDKIEDTAFSIGLTLLLRAEEDPHLHILRGRRHRGKRFLEEHQDEESEDDGLQGVLGHFVSSGSDTDSGMLCTRNKKCVHTKRTAHSAYRTKVSKVPLPSPNSGRSGLTTPRTDQRAGTDVRVKAVPSFQRVSETGNKLQRAPRLLYRWYNSESQGLNTPNQLRAGRFVDASCQIPTPEWDIESVSNHLIPEKKPSPFISFRDEMRPCMVHALHANENSNAYLTIIDFQSFLTASRQRLGDDSAARYCPTLVKRFALKLGRKGTYTGRGEWLLYGIVESETIITTARISDILRYIHSTSRMENIFQVDTLRAARIALVAQRRLWRSAPPMDFQTGKAVGSFAKFLHIPHLLLEEFCATLAVSWALQGSTKSKPNKEYDDFINGVFSTEGTPERSQVLTDDIVESVLTDEESYDENMSDTIEVSYATPPDEQDLIDIQLQRELASDLKRSNGVFEDSTTTSTTIHGQGASSHKYDMMIVDCAENIQQSRLERPRSSSLSPAPTDQSALDTFTAELLAKAEECSTIGSFGRGPSVSMRRETSEVQVVDRTRGEQDRQRGTRRLKGNVLQESPDVVELLSDDDNDRDDDDDDVQEMDFVILAARKIEA